MKKYWFQQKTYGYGITPISKEGWLMTLALLISILASAYSNNFTEENLIGGQSVVRFFLDVFILTSIFMIISKDKMEGELQWRWGN